MPSPGKRRNPLEENTGVTMEVATPAAEETSQATIQKEEIQAREDSNWKEAREVMKQQQVKIQELERRIFDEKKTEDRDQLNELDSLASDDIITVQQARNLTEQIVKRTADEIFSKNESEIRKLEVLQQFPDFNSIVSDENIRKLEHEHPAIAEGIAKSSNPYKGAYDVIKTFYKKENKESAEAKAAQENLSKPKSVHSQGYKGPLSEASKFESGTMTGEKRSEVWNLSQKYAAGR